MSGGGEGGGLSGFRQDLIWRGDSSGVALYGNNRRSPATLEIGRELPYMGVIQDLE